MVAGGRLRRGWEDEQAIKDVQRDVCQDAPRPYTSRVGFYGEQFRYHVVATTAVGSANQAPINPWEDFCKDTDDRACSPWNWGKDWF